jgi:hypothetical protein
MPEIPGHATKAVTTMNEGSSNAVKSLASGCVQSYALRQVTLQTKVIA